MLLTNKQIDVIMDLKDLQAIFKDLKIDKDTLATLYDYNIFSGLSIDKTVNYSYNGEVCITWEPRNYEEHQKANPIKIFMDSTGWSDKANETYTEIAELYDLKTTIYRTFDPQLFLVIDKSQPNDKCYMSGYDGTAVIKYISDKTNTKKDIINAMIEIYDNINTGDVAIDPVQFIDAYTTYSFTNFCYKYQDIIERSYPNLFTNGIIKGIDSKTKSDILDLVDLSTCQTISKLFDDSLLIQIDLTQID